MADYDAIIIGAGHNALTCALYLVRAGWRVIVIERAQEVGGAIRSGQATLPGFCHDLYATNVAQFAVSQVYRDFKADFDRFGVKLIRSEKPYASVDRTSALRVHTDTEATEAQFAAISRRDADGWKALTGFYIRTAPRFLPLFGSEMPSAEMWGHVGNILRSGPADAVRLGRLCLQTSRGFAAQFFDSEQARGVIASWAYHLDFGPDVAGGAIFAFVAAVSSHLFGAPVVQGGAGRLTSALADMVIASGGKVICRSEVSRVLTRKRRAVGVRTKAGEEYAAERAVIANVTPRNLFEQMLSEDDLSTRFLRRARKYRYGPGTFILHLALDRRPEWALADDLADFNYVHLNGSESEIADTYRQCLQGLLPATPLLIVSQPTAVDPSRAPPGKHAFRVHVRTVPGRINGDAAGKISARTWQEAGPAFAERIIKQVEQHIPNIRGSILASAVETPEDIERNNPNFIGGDCVSGSHHLDQNFICRPLFGWSRYETPIENLYMIGAATWPGGGVNAGSGYLAARKLLQKN